MLVGPMDNNAGGSCRGKQNFNKQSLTHQKSECSVRNVREPIQANLEISFEDSPEANFFKNDTCTESNERDVTGCNRIARNGACGSRPHEDSRPAEPTRADVSSDDLKISRCCRLTFDDEQQKGAGSSRRNNEPWTGRETLQVSTPMVRLAKDQITDQKSAAPSTLNNRTLTNRSDGILEFKEELCRVEQRRAQLMRYIERKQRTLMIENQDVRTSLQNYCEQRNSGNEKQSLHDTRERQPAQNETRECRPSQYDTRKFQQSHHNTKERRMSQYDTRKHRLSQYEIRERRPSHPDTRQRRSSQDDTRKRRPSQDHTRKRRPSQHDIGKRRSSQDDTRKRRPSQHDTGKRRPSQDNTRERRSSQNDLKKCQPSMLDTRERQSSKGESKNRKQPQGSFVVECFCNFIGSDNSCNIEPATKQVQRDESYQPSARGVSNGRSCFPIQVSSRHNNNNADNTTKVKVETARKDAASTGRHCGSSRRSTPRNDATATSPDSAEQHSSRQDTFQPRGCSNLRVVDLISSTNNSSVSSTQKHNNQG